MNRKGFTLIELLAVIVVLALVLIISVPLITDSYKNAKIKSEEVFIDRLSQAIDSYIKLNSDSLKFDSNIKGIKTEKDNTYKVNIKKGTIKITDIIADDIISESDFVNAGNKEVSCNINAQIEVYKDSDFVYCHKMKVDSLNCLSDNYKEKHKDETYAINTCIWEEEKVE